MQKIPKGKQIAKKLPKLQNYPTRSKAAYPPPRWVFGYLLIVCGRKVLILSGQGIEKIDFGVPGRENIDFWCSGERNIDFWCPGKENIVFGCSGVRKY